MITEIKKINEKIRQGSAEFVADVEREYHQRIKSEAEKIKKLGINIVLLAGPSGSGKTTTAKILCDYLRDLSKPCETVSLDDFYKSRERLPRDEYGQLDFESVDSLEIDDLTSCFLQLLKKGETELPVFNFGKKCREGNYRKINPGKDGVVIVEGLHALNPKITELLPKEKLYGVYISVGADYKDSEDNVLLDSRNIRLMRRISRDMIYRNSPPERSLNMWTWVVKGEDAYLCPFRSYADAEISSFHDYEICVFKTIMYDMLCRLKSDVDNYGCVEKIIAAMSLSDAIDMSAVPQDSLLREFMRGGKYE